MGGKKGDKRQKKWNNKMEELSSMVENAQVCT